MSDKITMDCPACREAGSDKSGNHLAVFPSGKFACAVHPGDKAHNRRIVELRPDLGKDDAFQPAQSKRSISHPGASKKENLGPVVATYPYHDETGRLIYEVRRHEPKTFRPYRIENSKPILGMGKIDPLPYRLPLVVGADRVIVVEGERDVETLEGLGYVATTNPFGAEKWESSWSHYFIGKEIILCGDNDVPGRRHMEQVEAALRPVAKSIKRVEVPAPAKDISDFIGSRSDNDTDVEVRAAVEELLARAEIVASPCVDWIDFNAEQDALPDAPELVKGMIRRGEKVSLGGSSKSKKTWTGLDLVISVASGKPWMGIETAKVPVVIVDMELRKKTLHLRIKKILEVRGITLNRGELHIIPLRGKVTTAEKAMAYVKANSPKKVGLFFIDPFYKLNAGKDENSAGDITLVMNLVDSLGTAFDAAILYSAHYSKGNQSSKDAIDRISGSGVYGRDADTIISMTAHEKPECFTIEPIFRSFAPMEPWVVRWNYPLMERADHLDPADLKKAPGMFEQKFSLDQLTDLIADRTMSSSEIERECWNKHEMSDSTVKRLLKTAENQGKVLKLKVGLWKGVTA